MNEDKLEVLVVDDLEENIEAAKSFFSTVEDANVTYANTYKEGHSKLRHSRCDIGMFDLKLPDGRGTLLSREASKRQIPWAIITTGIDHHSHVSAFVCYFWNTDKFQEITETPKTSPKAWQEVYQTLLNPFKNQEIYWSVKRICPENPAKILYTPIFKFSEFFLK